MEKYNSGELKQKIEKKENSNQRENKKKSYSRNGSTLRNTTVKFDFDDILIEPAEKSDVFSRETIRYKYIDNSNWGHLPIIAAPMDTVVSLDNLKEFTKNGINVCLPRGEFWEKHGNVDSKMIFNSYSLLDFTKYFISKGKVKSFPSHILIDIANGHMSDLVYVTKQAKKIYGKSMVLMVGNVANPKTYKSLSEAGADYVRIGIGNGGGCLTTEQTGIGYPMASLIKECNFVAKKMSKSKRAKIVADGGMKKYSDVIKALALGADYVMLGSIFNKSLESAGRNYFLNIPINQKMSNFIYGLGFKIKKKFRGMSTKEVQLKWGASKAKTSEGVIRFRNVEYRLSGWVSNFEHYLKSAMSYTNSKNLEEFIGKVNYNKITNNSFKRYNK